MSQTMATTVSKVQSREIRPTTTPIATLATPVAQTLSSVHPIILAGYFYLRFGALVADPVKTLSIDLLPIATMQAIYAGICLPLSKRMAALEQTTTPAKGKQTKSKDKKGSPGGAEVSTKVSSAVISLLLSAVATIPVFIVLVLFGAPLTTHHAQTFLCAAHFSLLAVFPLFYTRGAEKQAWWEIGGAMLPFDGVWGATIGTALGAWLGAVPIPLDWDREWQKWPVTIVAGMYAGALVGNFAGRYLLYGTRIQFRPDEEDKQDLKKSN